MVMPCKSAIQCCILDCRNNHKAQITSREKFKKKQAADLHGNNILGFSLLKSKLLAAGN